MGYVLCSSSFVSCYFMLQILRSSPPPISFSGYVSSAPWHDDPNAEENDGTIFVRRSKMSPRLPSMTFHHASLTLWRKSLDSYHPATHTTLWVDPPSVGVTVRWALRRRSRLASDFSFRINAAMLLPRAVLTWHRRLKTRISTSGVWALLIALLFFDSPSLLIKFCSGMSVL